MQKKVRRLRDLITSSATNIQ